MASRIWFLLTWATLAAAQQSTHTLTVQPKADDSRTGGVIFREKRANGTDTVEWSAPDALSATQRYRWPANNAAGYLRHVGGGVTSWDPSGAGFPLGEVRITDYGAVTDCSAAINTAFALALAALPVHGGIISFPPGCFLLSDTLVIGDGTPSGASTRHAIWLRGAGTTTRVGYGLATQLRWGGGGTLTRKPMVKFSGPFHGGGVMDMSLDMAEVVNVAAIDLIHTTSSTVERVTALASATHGPVLKLTTQASYEFGACQNRIDGFQSHGGVAGAGGILLDGDGPTDACSNLIMNGDIWFDASTQYGLKLRFADNNVFQKINLFGFGGGSNNGLVLEQYPTDPSFPKENLFYGVTSNTGIGGVSGTNGNTFYEFTTDDCGGLFCLPNIANVKGFSKGNWWGAQATPPEVLQNNNGAPGTSTLILHQYGGGTNDAGQLAFRRQNDDRALISGDVFNGLVYSTKSGAGAMTQRWAMIDAGHLLPWATSTYDLGAPTKRVRDAYIDTLQGNTTVLNALTFRSAAGGISRVAVDAAGFTLSNSLGAPTIIGFSNSGILTAQTMGASVGEFSTLRVTSLVDSSLIPSAAHALGSSGARWDGFFGTADITSLAATSLSAGTGNITNLTVAGTLTAGSFSPSAISTSTLTASTSITTPQYYVSHPSLSPVAGIGREAMTGFPTRFGGAITLQFQTGIGQFPYFIASPNFGLSVSGTINATSTYQINGANGYNGTCATTLVISGGIVTNCI